MRLLQQPTSRVDDKQISPSKSLQRISGKPEQENDPTCSGDPPTQAALSPETEPADASLSPDLADISFLFRRKLIRRSGSDFDPSRPSWLAGLPDEVLVRIFNYLPKPSLLSCARTCKTLYRVSFDESLWKRMDLGGDIWVHE